MCFAEIFVEVESHREACKKEEHPRHSERIIVEFIIFFQTWLNQTRSFSFYSDPIIVCLTASFSEKDILTCRTHAWQTTLLMSMCVCQDAILSMPLHLTLKVKLSLSVFLLRQVKISTWERHIKMFMTISQFQSYSHKCPSYFKEVLSLSRSLPYCVTFLQFRNWSLSPIFRHFSPLMFLNQKCQTLIIFIYLFIANVSITPLQLCFKRTLFSR